MKKLVLVLAVLIVSLPAMAAVTITADCNDGVYTVSYATDGNLPRAFALDITVATGTIDAVGGLSADYDIYPGSIVIIDGDVNDPGSAVCDDSYPDTLGGIGTAGITVEMGSLYADGDPAPAASGILFTFTTSEAETVATVTENGIRGGLVMEDPEEPIVPTITVVDCEGGCATCPGDMIGTTEVIDLSDLTEMVRVLSEAGSPFVIPVPPGNACGDMIGTTNVIDLSDLTEMVRVLSEAGSPFVVPCEE